MTKDMCSLKVYGAEKADLDSIKRVFSMSIFDVKCIDEGSGIYSFVSEDEYIEGIIDIKQQNDIFCYSRKEGTFQIKFDRKMKQKALFHFMLLLFGPGIYGGPDLLGIKQTIKQNCNHYYFAASNQQNVLYMEEKLLSNIYDNGERKADGIIVFVYGDTNLTMLTEVWECCASIMDKNGIDGDESSIVQSVVVDSLSDIEVSVFVHFNECETV